MFYTKLQSWWRNPGSWVDSIIFSLQYQSVQSLWSWGVGRGLVEGGWERTTVFAWFHSSGISLLMPFPAAARTLRITQQLLSRILSFFRKEMFSFVFLTFHDSPCLQIQVTLLQGLYSDIWLEINLSGDLSLHVSCLSPFYILCPLPCKHMFLFTVGLTEITTATIFTAFMLGS